MDPSPSAPMQTGQENQENSLRIKKRKLQDAFQTLDDAVQGPSTKKISTKSSKRPAISRSIYSTLQKYGISKNSKEESTPTTIFRSSTAPELADKTPHLSAILSRVATKAKSAFSFKFDRSGSASLPPTAEYRPSSLQSFLSRLETFKLATYSNKPAAIDAVAASRCGWTNDGKDRLVCGLCNASWVVAGREGLSRDAANALVEKQRQGLVDNHKTGCPWKTRQCDPSIYCVPLKTPTAMVRELKINAMLLDPLVSDIGIRHPLTPQQLSSLKKTVSRLKDKDDDAMEVDGESERQLSEAAILASTFGWTLVPPGSSERPRTASRSASMSASRPGTPSRPFISASAYVGSASRRASPSRSVSRRSSFSIPDSPSGSAPPLFKLPASLFQKRENTMVQCVLCQRRVGLWAFTQKKQDDTLQVPSDPSMSIDYSPSRPKKALPPRQFDLLKEHRSYCPYVVKSTTVPALPSPTTPTFNSHTRSASNRSVSSLANYNGNASTGGPVEGWRAVLAVALRYGLAQKHKEYDVFGQNSNNAGEEAMEEGDDGVDNVKSMVAGVKQQGGKDLLKYVKGLLG
ncbi:hypothetical protein NMY22_g7079 [Coprinellus aureogranulatus]|nr:hypothetical protein NMY22_g7079 [Coprinellus aureogranulatus]